MGWSVWGLVAPVVAAVGLWALNYLMLGLPGAVLAQIGLGQDRMASLGKDGWAVSLTTGMVAPWTILAVYPAYLVWPGGPWWAFALIGLAAYVAAGAALARRLAPPPAA